MTAPQMEDKPLLPMDNAVDRREWTLQHRKAADITLTPPQADLDMDLGLDVNVKGPGTVMITDSCLPRIMLARTQACCWLSQITEERYHHVLSCDLKWCSIILL